MRSVSVHRKWWAVLFGVVLLLEGLSVLISPVVGWWLPKNVSSFGGGVDLLYYVILIVTGFFFVLTEAILVYNMYHASTRPRTRSPYIHGNHKLELTWTIIPGAILLLLAIVQINVWADIKYQSRMPIPDKTVQQVEVTARQWEWRIRYPSSRRLESWANASSDDYKYFGTKGFEDHGQFDDVHGVNELHVVQGTRVLLHLKTRDVIHSFFLPNLRLKQDALPGKTIPVWFEVENRDGKNYNCARNTNGLWEDGYDPASNSWGHNDQHWELACAEFCGARHSMMRGKLYVHRDKADFLSWLKSVEEADRPPR
jgi:cytochrome c oxidase subunit 2